MDLIGEALVKIRPDLTGLKFQVQSEIAAALSGVSTASLGGRAGATTALAGSTALLATETRGLAGAALLAADAEGTLALALQVAGIRAGTAAAETVALASAQLGLAGASSQVVGAGAAAGAAGAAGAKGMKDLANQGNIARGALIGLARVTPVAVFGLGVAGTAAIAAAVGIREAISESANFEQRLNVFRVVSQATGEQMEEVSDRAKELGRDLSIPGASAGDAAQGMTELAKAGLSVRDSIDAARGVLQLAAAAEIETGFAAQIAASALNSFALPGREATRVADLLAAASISAQGEITDMAAALAQSASVAKQANISIDDTVTSISLLAKNGLLGSDAGTSLRTTILRLVPTTKEAAQFVRALGIEFEDTAGNLRPLPDIFEDYRTTLAKLPPVLRQAALQQIFGQDAIRAASILAREGAVGFEEMAAQVTREGVAAEVAAAKSQGLSGAAKGLSSNLETLGITIGSVVLPGLTLLVLSLAEAIGFLNLTAEAIGDFRDKVREEGGDGGFFEGFNDAVAGAAGSVTGLNDKLGISGLRGRVFGDGLSFAEQDARALKKGTDALQESLAGLGGGLSLGVVNEVREGLAGFGGGLAKGVVEAGKTVEPAAEEAGRGVGRRFGEGLGSEITKTEQRAIDAARDALADVIEAADDAVRQAAFAASDNLTQLGNDLNTQIQTLIDTGPIAQEIERLQTKLDSLQDRGEQRKLGSELQDAQAELAEARTSIGSFEFTTPEQRRQVEEFLRPFVDRVADAKSALAEFKLTDKIESLEDTQQAAKDAADLGLANLIQRFKDGKITAGEFQKLLTQQLQPAIDTLNSKAGKNLGLSFTSDFFQNVTNLVDQVNQLVGFLGLTGGPSPDVTRPGEVQAEQDERVADARKNLNQALEDAKATAEATTESSETLRRIERILKTSAAQAPGSPGGMKITPGEQKQIDLTAVTRG